MEGAKCPYCQAAYKEEEGKCAECKAIFPWAAEIKRLEDDVKSREVNRGRATFTLIDEVFKQAQGGKPVSVAALKGFAFAWLFPRTMIVVGSIITAAVLFAQTAIIFQQNQLIKGQNELMQKQTAAAQLDQAEKLRVRISTNADLVDRLTELAAIRMTRWSETDVDWSEQLNEEYLQKSFNVGTAFFGLLYRGNRGSLGSAMRELRDASKLYAEAKAPTGYTATTALSQADVRCSLDEAQTARAKSAVLSLKPFSDEPLGSDQYRGLLLVRKLKRFVELTEGAELDQASLKQTLKSTAESIRTTLNNAVAACIAKIKEDRAAVAELERKAAITSPATASAPSAASR